MRGVLRRVWWEGGASYLSGVLVRVMYLPCA
jgi:hypothetical protein